MIRINRRRWLALLAAASALSGAASAQDCDFPIIGALGTAPTDSVVNGDFAYAASFGGLQVLALTGADAPRQVGFIPLYDAIAVSIDNGTLYVLANFDGATLSALDLSNPAAPIMLGSVVLGADGASSLSVRNGLALVTGSYDATVVDVTQPEAMHILSTFGSSPTQIRSSALAGNTAVIARFSGALDTIDLTDPANPAPIASHPGLGGLEIGATDNVVFVLGAALSVLDLTDPAHPTIIGSTPLPATPLDLSIRGDLVAITTEDITQQLLLVDVSNLEAPTLLSAGFADAEGIYASTTSVSLGEHTALLMNWSRARVIDIADPADPTLEDESPVIGLYSGADLEGDILMLNARSRVDILSVSPSGEIAPLSSVPFPGTIGAISTGSLSISGDRAVVLRRPVWPHTMALMDISDLANPVVLDETTFEGQFAASTPTQIDLVDGVIYLAHSGVGERLWTYDADAPGLPRLGAIFGPTRFSINDGVLMGVYRNGQIGAYDTSDPVKLPILGVSEPIDQVSPFENWGWIVVDGPLAYLLSNIGRVAILDVSDPASMQLVTVFAATNALFDTFTGFAAHDRVVYVGESIPGDGSSGGLTQHWIKAIDTADPFAPVEIARRRLPDSGPYTSFDQTPRGLLVRSAGLAFFDFVTCPCPADLNGDGFVGMADLMLILDAFNTTPSDPNYNPNADTNGDKVIDFADLNVILASFNQPC